MPRPRKYTLNEHAFSSIKISTYIQRVYSRPMVEDLHKYGILPRKTDDHLVPVYIPQEPLASHFWRGLFD